MIYLRPDILMAIAVAACIGGGLAVAASVWWWSKRLETVTKRLERSDAAMQATSQQLVQARKQLQELKLEVASAKTKGPTTPPAQGPRLTVEQARAERARLEAELARKDIGDDLVVRGASANHGFADTQVIAGVSG